MTVNEIRDFIFGNHYKQIEFSKENSYYSLKHHEKKDLQFFATKLTEKISDPHDVKEEFQSFIRKKNTKSVKQSNIITQQPKLWKTHILFYESTKLISIFRKRTTLSNLKHHMFHT